MSKRESERERRERFKREGKREGKRERQGQRLFFLRSTGRGALGFRFLINIQQLEQADWAACRRGFDPIARQIDGKIVI